MTAVETTLNRFIPACAGNASRLPSPSCPWTAHPRVCGERRCRNALHGGLNGSSPRVRGTLSLCWLCSTRYRFIPACARNATADLLMMGMSAVHPRVCGERMKKRVRKIWGGGSSPRVRGTPTATRLYFVLLRFIPACAGNADQRAVLAP